MPNGWLSELQIHAQRWILPPSCILCGDVGQAPLLDICAPCAADLPPNLHPCPLCARPKTASQHCSWPCAQCIEHPPLFDRAVAPYVYDYPLDHLLQAFKYRGVLAYGRVLGLLLAQHLQMRVQSLPQALIPAPLHARRQRERGFNQSVELARPLSQLLGIPLLADRVRCRRLTQDQTELNAEQRRRNVRGAFEVVDMPERTHVAIIDDVLTTGSTAGELARVLKLQGVKKVEVWAIARAR